MAMSGLRLDPRLLSPAASAPGDRVQVQSADGADSAVFDLWLSGFYPQRGFGQALSAAVCAASLSVDVVGAAAVLLGVSQHSLVSVCVVNYLSLATRLAV